MPYVRAEILDYGARLHRHELPLVIAIGIDVKDLVMTAEVSSLIEPLCGIVC
jgi:hypothetical protein